MALDDRLLEMKKNVIRQTVKKICTEDGVKEPLINFEGCPEENKWGQLAHSGVKPAVLFPISVATCVKSVLCA